MVSARTATISVKQSARKVDPKITKPKAFGHKGRSIGTETPVFNSLKTHNLYTYRNNVT